MSGHRLRREIVATVLANEVVNRAGTTFVFRMHEETGASPAEVVRAHLIAKRVFSVSDVWSEIETLDNRVSASAQTAAMLEMRKLVERASRWILRNRPAPLTIQSCIDDLRPGVGKIAIRLQAELAGSEEAAALERTGLPAELAARIAAGERLLGALDIVDVANRNRLAPNRVADVYFELGRRLELDWLLERIVDLPRDNRWQTLARAAMRDDLYGEQRLLADAVLGAAEPGDEPGAAVERWTAANAGPVARCRQVITDLMTGPSVDFSMLSVAMRELRRLGQSVPPGLDGHHLDAAAD
jgi:glutamate dehydrogenase